MPHPPIPYSLVTAVTKLTVALSLVFAVLQTASATNSPTVGAPINTPTYTFFGAGRYIFDHSQADQMNFNDATVLVAGLEKSWFPYWGTDVRYLYAEPDVHHGQHVRFNQLDLSAVFYIVPANTHGWQPYVSLGGGAARLDSDDNLVATLGTGVRWHLTDKIALKADYRLNHVLDEDQTDQLISLGINATFTSNSKNALGSTNKGPVQRKTKQTLIEPKSLAKDINLLMTHL